jgi:hypothetical protein
LIRSLRVHNSKWSAIACCSLRTLCSKASASGVRKPAEVPSSTSSKRINTVQIALSFPSKNKYRTDSPFVPFYINLNTLSQSTYSRATSTSIPSLSLPIFEPFFFQTIMTRQRRSGAQQRAYKAAKRLEARCQNERSRRSLAELHATEREIFRQLQGKNLFLITLPGP